MHSFWNVIKSVKGVLAKFYIWTGPRLCPKVLQNPEKNMYCYKKHAKVPMNKFCAKRNVSPFSSFCGSITAEAALVLPLFLFFCMQIISFICLFGLHSTIAMSLHQEVSALALQSYAYEALGADMDSVLTDVLGEAAVKHRVIERIGRDYLDASMIDGGSGGIWVVFGQKENTQDVVDVTLSYRVKPLFGILGFSGFSMANRCSMKAWTGYKQAPYAADETVMEEYVYLAENGEVYHKSRQCTHLALSVCEVESKSLDVLRNADGGKYYACERCGKEKQKTVFVTEEGNRYHTSLMCSGLKRTIYVIRLSEAGGKRACSRCGGI